MYMIPSRTFKNTGKTKIDLQIVTFYASPGLNRAVTFAIFTLLGKVHC